MELESRCFSSKRMNGKCYNYIVFKEAQVITYLLLQTYKYPYRLDPMRYFSTLKIKYDTHSESCKFTHSALEFGPSPHQ